MLKVYTTHIRNLYLSHMQCTHSLSVFLNQTRCAEPKFANQGEGGGVGAKEDSVQKHRDELIERPKHRGHGESSELCREHVDLYGRTGCL